jgi:hypothetical protein
MSNDLLIKDATETVADIEREENDVLLCDECQNATFLPVYVLVWRKTMFNPSLPRDGWAPMQTFRCSKCGHINADMDPRNSIEFEEE